MTDTEITSQLEEHSGQILMCLVSSQKPAEAIFRKYTEAQDKDTFVAALIGCLMLRHRQWLGKGAGDV